MRAASTASEDRSVGEERYLSANWVGSMSCSQSGGRACESEGELLWKVPCGVVEEQSRAKKGGMVMRLSRKCTREDHDPPR